MMMGYLREVEKKHGLAGNLCNIKDMGEGIEQHEYSENHMVRCYLYGTKFSFRAEMFGVLTLAGARVLILSRGVQSQPVRGQTRQNSTSVRDWVNPSKKGGMDGVFQGLAGLLRGISRGQDLREIPRSSPASPRKAPSIPTLLLRFTFNLE